LAGSENLNAQTTAEIDWLHPDRLEKGYRLGCQAQIEQGGSVEVVTRAEILKRQFIASFNPRPGESIGENTNKFFENLTTITIQHLEMFPGNVAKSLRWAGPLRLVFPWRNPAAWLEDSTRVISNQLNGIGSSRPAAEVEIEEIEDDDFVTPAAEPAPTHVMPSEIKVPAAPVKSDDLTVIEGIGPKISRALHAAGITSFAQLAASEVGKIQAILDKEPNLRLADPSSWSNQALLAAEGKWAELKTLQDALKGGRI
jgi:predicted flap endonuclease-1-like 5' DNA nuclease